MRTITAKELRDNLWEITNRIQAGEHIKVTYHEKDVFIIKPLTETVRKMSHGVLRGLTAFDACPSKGINSIRRNQ